MVNSKIAVIGLGYVGLPLAHAFSLMKSSYHNHLTPKTRLEDHASRTL